MGEPVTQSFHCATKETPRRTQNGREKRSWQIAGYVSPQILDILIDSKKQRARDWLMELFDDVTQNCDLLCFSLKQKFLAMLVPWHTLLLKYWQIWARISASLQRICLKLLRLTKLDTINRFMEINFCFNEKQEIAILRDIVEKVHCLVTCSAVCQGFLHAAILNVELSLGTRCATNPKNVCIAFNFSCAVFTVQLQSERL